jgi:hypothetical protein
LPIIQSSRMRRLAAATSRRNREGGCGGAAFCGMPFIFYLSTQ